LSIQFSPEQVAILDQFDAEVRFPSVAETYKDNPIPGGVPVIDEKKSKFVGVYCEIIDKTVKGNPYIRVRGADRTDALAKALENIVGATKPMTKAQAAAAEATKAVMQSKDDEIAQLRKLLEEKGIEAPPKLATPVVEPPKQVVAPPKPTIARKAVNIPGLPTGSS